MISANARSFLLVVLVAAVCSPLQAADTQVHVVPDSQLKEWWQAPPGRPNVTPPYPIAVAQAGVGGCVAVAFEIHGDGSVSNERIWKSELTKAPVTKQFEQAILAAVHKWRFVPVAANVEHAPVYTYQVFTFGLTRIYPMAGIDIPTNADRRRAQRQDAGLQAKCEMSDFPQQVQAMINSAQAGKKP